MEVTVAIFLGFDKCFCIQFLTLVEYNKKGLTYVELTHQNHECSISNGLYKLVKQSVTNYKILDMDFYLIMCLCNVCETLGYKIFEVKNIKGSFSEWNIVLIFMFHNIKYATFEIFHKVHKGIKNVDFLVFFLKKENLLNGF